MLSIVIQAGGESRRMGQDKGLAPFLGKTLIEQVIARLAPLAEEVLVTTNRLEAYRFLNLPLFPDRLPGRGALGGLFTALSAAKQELVAVVACDMPFASPAILATGRDILLAGEADAVIPRSPGGLEPFHAVYRRASCLPAVEAALNAQRWRADSWYEDAHIHILEKEAWLPLDRLELAFLNANTPEELKQAEDLAKSMT